MGARRVSGVQVKPHGLTGRPSNRKGKGLRAPSSTRSIRLPDVLWEAVEDAATAQGLTVNAYVCELLKGVIASSADLPA